MTSLARIRVTSVPTVLYRLHVKNLETERVKAIYQYVAFKCVGTDASHNMVNVQVRNKYAFLSLKGFDLKWESVKNGVIVGADSFETGKYPSGRFYGAESETVWR